jgi:ABC-type branched-subunit amino acid transport system ATPase component
MGALVVAQHTQQALAHADRVYVMSRGRIVASGSAEEIRRRWDVIRSAYLARAEVPEP